MHGHGHLLTLGGALGGGAMLVAGVICIGVELCWGYMYRGGAMNKKDKNVIVQMNKQNNSERHCAHVACAHTRSSSRDAASQDAASLT